MSRPHRRGRIEVHQSEGSSETKFLLSASAMFTQFVVVRVFGCSAQTQACNYPGRKCSVALNGQLDTQRRANARQRKAVISNANWYRCGLKLSTESESLTPRRVGIKSRTAETSRQLPPSRLSRHIQQSNPSETSGSVGLSP